MTVAISSNIAAQVLTVKAVLTMGLANLVAEAFTPAYDKDCVLHGLLQKAYGIRSHTWYSVDQSGTIFRIMYSSAEKPSVLTFRGQPAQIASEDAEMFSVYLQEVDFIRPNRSLTRRPYPHLIKDIP